ncbi:FKBP-type peptidyl-prolyl cis-trans isomerase [Thalassotalea fusca]
MKLFKPTLVALSLIAATGCQQETKEAPKKEVVLETEVQKQSYSLGASIGMYVQSNLEKQAEFDVNLEQDYIIQGFTDSLAGKSLIEKEEVQALLMNLDQAVKAKQEEKIKLSAEKALEEGTKFLAENANKEGVTVTETGLQYQVIAEGEGEKPKAEDTVRVHYHGTFLNGEIFDSSVDRGKPATFPLNGVISGWTEGVQLMSVGSKYKFTIPSELAYGPVGNPPRIPGNSVLEFEVELLEIVKPKEPVQVGDAKSE